MAGTEGLNPRIDAYYASGEWLDDDVRRERLLRLIRRVESEPSALGATAHLVVFGRRP